MTIYLNIYVLTITTPKRRSRGQLGGYINIFFGNEPSNLDVYPDILPSESVNVCFYYMNDLKKLERE